jgi:subtilisin family serine protease
MQSDGHRARRPRQRGRARREPIAALALAAACAGGAAAAAPAHAGLVTPELEGALREALPVERVPVIATLADQADPPRGADPTQILGALRRVADGAQPGLLTRLGLSGQVERHWLVNAISVRAIPLEVRLLAADPAVASVDLDPAVTAVAARPRGARLLQAGSRSWGLDAVRAPEAWRELGATGASVRIGSIDTGADGRHPALAGKIADWRDVVGRRAAPYDDHGHGTHTAGTLAGADVGVAPGAKLLVAKAIPGSGRGSGSDIIAAAEWMADPDGNPATSDFPRVISSSWGEAADPNDTWFRPYLRRWRSLGIVAAFASGNTGPSAGTVGSPSGYPEALAVGAVDRDRRVAPFSSRGPVQWQNRDGLGPAAGPVVKPDLVGPGVGVLSSVPGGGYAEFSGTSMAAPHVAGAAALMLSINASLSAGEVERVLRATAVDAGPAGRDGEAGDGLVDALAAARQAAQAPGARRRVTRTRSRGRVRLTVAQLRINRRIALTAAVRVAKLEARLGMPPRPTPVTRAARAPIRRLSDDQMRLTQRISQSALRRAALVQRHVTLSTAPAVAAAGRGSGGIRLSVRQLRINQRIAQAALRRVTEIETRAEGSGLLPQG